MAEPESISLSSAFLSTLESIATWRAALFRALDSSDRANVAQTCHAAQQLLLTEWPSATLRMSVQPAYLQPAAALLRRMHRVRQQLALRGGKPVTLALQPDGYVAKEDVWWHTTFSALGTGQPWPGLTLELRFQHIQPQLLSFAGQALPGLKTLSIGCLYGSASDTALPPPTSLPALRHLQIVKVSGDSCQALWSSVAPYLGQLKSLSLPRISASSTAEGPPDQPSWRAVFGPRVRSSTLQCLCIAGCELDPWLVRLLQRKAPRLAELSVHSVRKRPPSVPPPGAPATAPVSDVCSWKLLNVHTFDIAALSWMPLPADGKLCIRVASTAAGEDDAGTVSASLPIADAVAAKLGRVEFTGHKNVTISADTPGPARHPHAQPAALRAALPLLTPTLQAPGVGLTLKDFKMTEGLAVEITVAATPAPPVATAAAGWAWLSITDAEWWAHESAVTTRLPPLQDLTLLNDYTSVDTLAQIARCAPVVNGGVYVPGHGLPTALPEGVDRLPWAFVGDIGSLGDTETSVDWMQETEKSVVTRWQVEGICINLTTDEVDSGEHYKIAQQLSRITNMTLNEFELKKHSDVAIQDEARVLRASLAIARAVPTQAKKMAVLGWTACDAVITELRNLPQWHTQLVLNLHSATKLGMQLHFWPLARAPWAIPRSYKEWAIHAEHLSPGELEALITHAPGDRTESEPLTIILKDRGVMGLAEQVAMMGMYPRVRVVHHTEL